MGAAQELAESIGTAGACEALALPRSSFYRLEQPPQEGETEPRPERAPSPRALSSAERQAVLDVLHSERFCDRAPAEVYAALADEGRYIASVRTMYRILAEEGEVRERRNQLRHPVYVRPELVATGPNQVWSWDITKLLGPVKWTYFHLYVVIDIFSRLVVGWMVAPRESAELAMRLLGESCRKHGVEPGRLTIHADRGSSMKSKPVALLLADLGVTKTHSRPRVSNDNPYSESQFKTLKYSPQFPERFATLEQARAFCGPFFDWYNREHHHSGLHLLTPAQVHLGQAEAVLAERHRVLLAAYEAHPERFVHGAPQLKALPKEVWINRPERALALEEGPSSSTSSFPPSGPSPVAGAAERKTAEAPPAGTTTTEQTSEPPRGRRTRRKAGGVTSRNEPNQRLGATAAAGGGTGTVPSVESSSTVDSADPDQDCIHPSGGGLIETDPERH